MKRLTRPQALERISKELEEIENEFAWQGFPTDEDPTANEEWTETEEDDEDDTETDNEDEVDDSVTAEPNAEDIEIAIDTFVSNLVKARVIPATKNISTAFSQVFKHYFDKEHSITTLAQSFEQAVQGYFGAIHYEDMREAQHQLREIRRLLNEELKSIGSH